MVRVAPINLTFNPKTLWFDPGELEIEKDMPVVVRTARGTEFGIAASETIEVPEEQVRALKSALRPVERVATEEDVQRAAEMEEKSREALPIFKEMAREAHEDMHPVSVEFLLDGDKAVFYFEAEERIDFRELVRKLASRFHVRIDMRQIGVRDEARMVGGIGHCGQELCCKRLGGEFCPVSIRMAKEQGLSLNPQKISGLCGRLMCCLRYEFDAYKDFKTRSPKVGATVTTPAGPAKVVDLDVPRELVSVRIEGEKPVRIPIAGFEKKEDGSRPSVVTEDAWAEAMSLLRRIRCFSFSFFCLRSRLVVLCFFFLSNPSRKKSQPGAGSGFGKSGERSRRGRQDKVSVKPAERKPRRRSTTLSTDGSVPQEGQAARRGGERSDEQRHGNAKRQRPQAARSGGQAKGEAAEKRRSSSGKQRRQGPRSEGAEQSKKATRPGQRSSGLSRPPAAPASGGGAAAEGASSSRRRRRRRSRGTGEAQE